MVQYFETDTSTTGRLAELLGQSLGQGLGNFTGDYFANRSLESVLQDKSLKNAPVSERLSRLESALRPHGERGQKIFQNRLIIEQQKMNEDSLKRDKKKSDILRRKLDGEQVLPEEEEMFTPRELLDIKKAMAVKAPTGGLSGQPVPEDVGAKIEDVVKNNPKANADQLALEFDKSGIPRAYSGSYIENRRRSEELSGKTGEDKRRELRKETLPIRTDLAKKSQAAQQGIQNKQQLLDLIRKGNIDDPTFAALAEALPLKLGKRLLSNDTVEYKSGLIEEFGDLKNLFPGQVRVKEIDLLEEKIADLYLTDEQKEAILKSRINALKADVIRAESAAQLEDRDDLGVLQFNAEVEKLAKPKLDALFNQILDDQKSILDSAERRKNSNIPLDPKDPDDFNILQQILKEAGGDKVEARRIAAKKGYKF